MKVTVCRSGLHARPAAVFVKAVLDSGSRVWLGREGGEPVDARSIVSVLALDIGPGERVVISGDEEIVDALAVLLEADQ